MYGKKPKGHVSFLLIGEQEREIQNAQGQISQRDLSQGFKSKTLVLARSGI